MLFAILLLLGFARCYNWTVTPIQNSLESSISMDTTMDTNGYPLIASYRLFSGFTNLIYYQCEDRLCISSTKTTLDSESAIIIESNQDPSHISLTLDNQDRPNIAFQKAVSGDLYYRSCRDRTCWLQDFDTTLSGDLEYPSMITSTNNNYILSRNKTSKHIYKHQCTLPDCPSFSGPVEITINIEGKLISSIMNNDKLIFVHQDAIDKLRFTRCDNDACSVSNTENLNTLNGSLYISLIVGSDGNPFISFFASNDNKLGYIKCKNILCSGSIESVYKDVVPTYGIYMSSMLGSNGYPQIVYYDHTNKDIVLETCNNHNCSISSTEVVQSNVNITSRILLLKGQYDLPTIIYRRGDDLNLYTVTHGCLGGNYYNSSGNCQQCNLGEYSSNGTSSSCTLCSAGSYEDTLGSTSCKLCPVGSNGIVIGSSISSDCISCSIGSHQDEQGQTSCKLCNPGSFSDNTGSESCNLCDEGSYQDIEGQDDCKECPTGGICTKGAIIPVSAYGHNVDPNDPFTFYPCSPAEACPGNNECEKGYETKETFCSGCSKGFYRIQGKCAECSNDTGFIIVLMVIAYIGFILIIVPLGAEGHKFGMASMFASYIQILSLYGYFNINGGSTWNALFRTLSVSLFNVELVAPECTGGGLRFYPMWRLQMALPLISISTLLIYYNVLRKLNIRFPLADSIQEDMVTGFKDNLKRVINGVRTSDVNRLRNYFYGAALFIFTLLYAIITKSAVTIIDCEEHSGRQVLGSDYSIECNTDEWKAHVWFAYLMLIIYTVGLPIFILVMFTLNRGILSDPNIRLIFGCVLDRYKEEYAYMEFLTMIKKAIIIFIAIFMTNYVAWGIAIILMLIVLNLILQYKLKPYWTEWLNYFDYMSNGCSVLILTFAIILSENPRLNSSGKVTFGIISIVLVFLSIIIGIYLGYKHGKHMSITNKATKARINVISQDVSTESSGKLTGFYTQT